MADVETYSATACGISSKTYEVPIDDVDGWPASNTLGVVYDPGRVCVIIDRQSTSMTPVENVTAVSDSGTTDCETCEEG